jgi:hypothetical protein
MKKGERKRRGEKQIWLYLAKFTNNFQAESAS